jgi:RHS repeat-associated protein
VNTTYGYDNLSRLLSVTHAKTGTTLDGASYTVDNAGNRLTRTPLPSGTTSTYGYDNIYELQSVTQNGSTTESYTYDPVGNRLTSLGSATWNYNTSNELNSRPSYSYTYDYNGNTQTKVVGTNTTTYAWDYENRLTSVTLPGSGGTVSFKYDPWGRRIYKSSTSGTSIYAYDGDDLSEETNSTGAVVARYARTEIIDEPLAMLRGGTASYYEADGLWSVTSLSNAAGALAQTYTFDSFGKLTNSSGSLTNPFQYNAREFDTETNLYYYRARYYDQNVGRFISEDPINFSGGINFYEYVKNQPIDNFDPFGLKCTKKLMLVTAYCDQGRTASGRFAGPGTVAVANTNAPSRGPDRQPIPYPFGCSVNVSGPLKDPVFNRTPIDPFNTPDYTGTVNDTGAGWDKKHHHVPPDRWIDIWLRSCKQARKYGLQWREVTICCPDDCGK